MKDENTRSNEPSAYGSSSENPRSKLNGDLRPVRLASRAEQRFRVRVEPDDVDIGMTRLEHHDQGAGAAAHVEHAMPWAKVSLIEQDPQGPIAAEQLHEGVVERQRPVVAGRRKVWPSRRYHDVEPSRT